MDLGHLAIYCDFCVVAAVGVARWHLFPGVLHILDHTQHGKLICSEAPSYICKVLETC